MTPTEQLAYSKSIHKRRHSRMSKLLMLRGLPASGKSTYAKELADKGWIRVNKDDLRAMLNNSNWSKGNEKRVLKLRDDIIALS